MTQPQPGWYPDPADPKRHRYWAGDSWTAETRNIDQAATTPPDSPDAPNTADPYANYAAGAVGAQPAIPQYMGPVGAMRVVGPATPDGVPLAGWWWRFLAYILDGLILGVIGTVVLFLIPNLIDKMREYVTAVFNTRLNDPTATVPTIWDPVFGIGHSLLIYNIITIVISIAYVTLMLGRFGATLGQLACGLRIVPVGQGQHKGGLPASNLVARLIFYTLVTEVLGIIAMYLNVNGFSNGSLISGIGSIYLYLSCLWAAWDPKRQALHDKLARTQVVRTR